MTVRCHPSITVERLLDAMDRYTRCLDNPGFCLSCGADAEGVEPDARGYECDACGAMSVFGASEVLLMGVVVCRD